MPRKKAKTPIRTVEVVDSIYQPSKAKLETEVNIKASPNEVARTLMSIVNTHRVKKAAGEMRSNLSPK